jgi:uncharacterized protein (DUF1810 family)
MFHEKGIAAAGTTLFLRHSGMTSDPHNLQRFLDAQQDTYAVALAELRQGRKSSHWMWFVFPQLAGLGRSPAAQHYAIASLDETRAYLEQATLGQRLRDCVRAMQDLPHGNSAAACWATWTP